MRVLCTKGSFGIYKGEIHVKKKVYAEVVAWHFVGFRFLDVKPFCFSECPHVFTMARPRPLKSKGDAFDVLHFFPKQRNPSCRRALGCALHYTHAFATHVCNEEIVGEFVPVSITYPSSRIVPFTAASLLSACLSTVSVWEGNLF